MEGMEECIPGRLPLLLTFWVVSLDDERSKDGHSCCPSMCNVLGFTEGWNGLYDPFRQNWGKKVELSKTQIFDPIYDRAAL